MRPVVPYTESDFLELLRHAIRDYHAGQFLEKVTAYPDMSDVVLSDDGSFESLCNRNNYVLFIHQLVDCWVDSVGHPEAYPNMPADEWVHIAISLLDDIENRRVPSHPLWNTIFTLRCERCHGPTQLVDNRFYCAACDHTTYLSHDERRSPSQQVMNEAILQSVFDDPFPFGLVGYHDFFAATEMASHVRFVRTEVMDHPEFFRERILTWILRRGPCRYRAGWREALRNTRFSVADEKQLIDTIQNAAADVRNSDYTSMMMDLPCESDLVNVDGIRNIEGANLYAAGPTHMLCWWKVTLLNYLEIHWES